METFEIPSYKAQKRKTKKAFLGALPVVSVVYISQNTHSKSILVLILRGQPTFCNQQFARYGFWVILGFSAKFWPKKWILLTF